MKKENRIVITGNNNTSISSIKKSHIKIDGKESSRTKANNFWAIAGVIVSIIALLIQVIIGWSDVIKFIKQLFI